jgi:hypothetical protein
MISDSRVDCGNDETGMNQSRTTGRAEKGLKKLVVEIGAKGNRERAELTLYRRF